MWWPKKSILKRLCCTIHDIETRSQGFTGNTQAYQGEGLAFIQVWAYLGPRSPVDTFHHWACSPRARAEDGCPHHGSLPLPPVRRAQLRWGYSYFNILLNKLEIGCKLNYTAKYLFFLFFFFSFQSFSKKYCGPGVTSCEPGEDPGTHSPTRFSF